MDLSCNQVNSLLPFYIDNNLNQTLKILVDIHLQNCPKCREKYEILVKAFSGLAEAKDQIDKINSPITSRHDNIITSKTSEKDYALVQNLSAYSDNELSDEENLKIKKYVITNLYARKTLEEIYDVKNLLQESFERSKMQVKNNFSKEIFNQLNIKDEIGKENPMIRVVSMLILISVLCVAGAVFVFWA